MSSFRFTPHAANKMRQAIHDAGVEVFAIGDVNEAGMVYDLEIHCRGNEGSHLPFSQDTPRVKSSYTTIPVVFLRASEVDMYLANRYGDDGVGVIIVNNNVDDDFWVVEPHKDTAERLDPAEVQSIL